VIFWLVMFFIYFFFHRYLLFYHKQILEYEWWKTKTDGLNREGTGNWWVTLESAWDSHGRNCELWELFNTLISSYKLWMKFGGHNLLVKIICITDRYIESCLFCNNGNRKTVLEHIQTRIKYSVLCHCLKMTLSSQ
jgi:hypothetical protein